MTLPFRRSRWTFLLVVTVVLLAGCTGAIGLGETDEAEADDFENETDEATEVAALLAETPPPETLEATRVTSAASENDSTTITERVWLRDDGASRTEGVEEEYVVVSDGERHWHHDLETDSATSLETQPIDESWFERVAAEQERYLEEFDVASVDETTVDGREAIRVTFDEPHTETLERSIDVLVGETTYRIPLETSPDPPDEGDVGAVEIAFDEETAFPLEYRLVTDEGSFVVAYEDVSFDGDIDDDRFAFEPPESEPVEEIVLPIIDEFNDVEEAAATVSFDVVEPPTDALPEEVALDGVSRYEFPDENRTQVSLFYRSADHETVSVTTGDEARGYAADGDEVTIDDAPGRIERTSQGMELEWECERHVSIFVDDAFDSETALELAASIGCDHD